MFSKRFKSSIISVATKSSMVAAIVLVSMSFPWFMINESGAVSGGPTGWCTDHSGRNYRCGSGGGGSSGGGVCAQAMREKRHADAESRLTAIFFNNSGVKHYKKKDYIKAVSSFETAINQDPSYSVAKNNLSNALAGLGVQAYARRDYESSLLYHERALELRDSLNHRNNVKSSRRKVKNGGKKTCTMCSKAYISDVG